MGNQRSEADKVAVVGVGPGSVEYLTNEAEREIDAADVLIGGRRVIDVLGKGRHEKLFFEDVWSDIGGVIRDKRVTKRVAILVSGDPGLYSLLTVLRRHFAASELRVIPGISTVQLLFARLAETWHDVRIESLHGRPLESLDEFWGSGRLCLLTDDVNTPAKIGAYLLDHGLGGRAVVGERLGYTDERVETLDIKGLAKAETESLAVIYLDLTETREAAR